jgi:arylsulfatase A-like enzyme
MHLRTIYRDGYTLTVYEKSTRDVGFDLANVPPMFAPRGAIADIRYDGTEGELYNLREDPLQWRNLWNDPASAQLKSDLRTDLYDNLPRERDPKLPVEAPA